MYEKKFNSSLILLSVMDKRYIYFSHEPEFNWEKECPTSSYEEFLKYNPSYRSLKLHNLQSIQSRRQNAIILQVIY